MDINLSPAISGFGQKNWSGDCRTEKTGISFLVHVRFAGAVLWKKWLEARLWLKHPVEYPCLRRIEKVGPRDFIHYFRIQSVDNMDESFVSFLCESYAIGIQEDFIEGQESAL